MDILELINWFTSQQILDRISQIEAKILAESLKPKEIPWVQILPSIPAFLTLGVTAWVARIAANSNKEIKEREHRLGFLKEVILKRLQLYDKFFEFADKYSENSFNQEGVEYRFNSPDKVMVLVGDAKKMAGHVVFLRHKTAVYFTEKVLDYAIFMGNTANEISKKTTLNNPNDFYKQMHPFVHILEKRIFRLREHLYEDLAYIDDLEEYKREIKLRRQMSRPDPDDSVGSESSRTNS